MRKRLFLCAAMFAALCLCVSGLRSETRESLRLVQTISMPNVNGRIDHMDVDARGKRLFVAGLGNGSIEVIDLQSGKWLRSIPGFHKPQGIVYLPGLNKLVVASGEDGTLRILRGDTFDLLDSIKLESGPNRIAFDPHAKLLYVGYDSQGAGSGHGEVAIVNARTDKHIGDIRIASHPAEMLLSRSRHMLFVLLPRVNEVQVIDTRRRRVLSTWPVSSQQPGDAALDERTQRLFVGTHTPPQMIAMDAKTGKQVAQLPTAPGMDGVYFNGTRRRIYISGGRGSDVGSISVYQQVDPDDYKPIGKVPTRSGAGTSFWSPELDRYYVAAPASGKDRAAILVFEPISD